MPKFQPAEKALVFVRGQWTVVTIIKLRPDGYNCLMPNGWHETFTEDRLVAESDQASGKVVVAAASISEEAGDQASIKAEVK